MKSSLCCKLDNVKDPATTYHVDVVARPVSCMAALFLFLAGCRSTPPPAIDPGMSSCVPPTATLLAGLDLDRLRSSAIYSKLPPAATLVLEPYREAHYVMLASDGKTLLAIARGPFHQPPTGATLLRPNLAIAGDSALVQAAASQYKSGKSGAPDLIADAARLAPSAPIWIVARGGGMLPLTGNWANVNRLLRNSEYAAISVKLEPQIEIAATVLGRTADAARQVEETLRAALTLAAAGESRQSDLSALLKSIQVTREDRTVRAILTTTPDAVQKLLAALTP